MHFLLYWLAIFSLSQSASLVRWAAAPPEVIGFWRLTIGALLMLPWALRSKDLNAEFWRQKSRWMPTLLSALFFFAHLWTYVYSAQHTRISHCMILFAANPVFTALGARLFFHERFTWKMGVAYLFGAAGLFQLVSHSLAFETGLLWGDLSAVASAAFFAGYLLTGKGARRQLSNGTYTVVMYFTTGLLFGLAGALQQMDFIHWPSNTWLGIAGTILLPTLLGHALFSWLMNSMNINLMTCGKIVEPVMAAAIAWLAFGEEVTLAAASSFILTGVAVVVLFFPWGKVRKWVVSEN